MVNATTTLLSFFCLLAKAARIARLELFTRLTEGRCCARKAGNDGVQPYSLDQAGDRVMRDQSNCVPSRRSMAQPVTIASCPIDAE